jgi:hypothetical protein
MSCTNCWEAKRCGREPGNDQDVCPVFEAAEYDGVNEGQYAGRFCWAVAGTLCHGEVQGTFAEKAMDCMKCDFYKVVVQEQGAQQVVISPAQLA